jgi:four helix bundle protein
MHLTDEKFLGIERARSNIVMTPNSRADDLEERLVRFAIDIVTLTGQLPQNFQAKHIATQLLRSGTAAAPNYGEARAAESRADFIHKLKIALKELNETAIWLRIVQGGFAINADFLTRLVAENTELCKILVASIQTARRNTAASPG